MNLQEFTSGTPSTKPWLDIVCDELNANSIKINGVPIEPATTGTYNSNIVITNATNVVLEETGFIKNGKACQIFGQFRCDVGAFSGIAMAIDIIPGTTSNLLKRSFYLNSNKFLAGAVAFTGINDSNFTLTRLNLSSGTFNNVACVPANQLNTVFQYGLTYISEI
jgi:hypothetical protein